MGADKQHHLDMVSLCGGEHGGPLHRVSHHL